MRVGVDARELCGRPTGVGRYLAGLLTEWSRSDRARRHEFILYAPQPIGMAIDTRRFATREVPGSGGTFWEQAQEPRSARRDHLDVWFAPGYSAPLMLAIPTVVAIHDLSFAAHPEWFTWREGAKRRLVVRKSAERARAIVTISHFTRGELIERLAIPASRIHVIPPGITHPAPRHQHPAPSTQRPASLKVLFTGSIFNRRRVPDLIRAFAPIARAHPDAVLEIAGDDRTYPRQELGAIIAGEGVQDRVRWHRYVTEDQLAELYAGARAFAFLSEYEGLGLTPLEALAAGVPPVLLDTPVAHESCGDAALYVPAGDLRATTEALREVLFSETTRQTVLDAAPRALARYRWSDAARDTLTLLEASIS